MNTRALNALAGVICAAQKQGRRTPMGIAQAIDAAQMLQSPETAAELVALRAEAKQLRGDLDSAVGDCVRLSEERDEAREAVAGLSRDLRDATHWEGVADRLRARVAELVGQRDDALAELAALPDTYVDCRVCGAGRLAGKPCGICEFNARMTAEAGEPV